MSITTDSKILMGSGVFASTLGLAAFFKFEPLLKIMDAKGTVMKSSDATRYMLASAVCGWAVGKLTAATTSQDATIKFCTWNMIPMMIGMYGGYSQGDQATVATNGIFAAVYCA